jgi:predicted O-methyltransferase YrrM
MATTNSTRSSDPWRQIQIETDRHRSQHGCWAYPHADGRLLGVLAAAIGAKRILELGTALGYTAVWLAHGAPAALVDTLERDPQHVALAREAIAKAGMDSRITVHQGDFSAVLPTLSFGYDLAFFDGYAPALPELDGLRRLLRPGGLLVSANQELSGPESAGYRSQLLDPRHWFSAPLGDDSEMTLSVRVTTPL